MCVGMVRLVAMDMVFPTGSTKIGRDGCRRERGRGEKTHVLIQMPKPLQLCGRLILFFCCKAMYPFYANDSSSSMLCNLPTLIFL